jgi:hypothetical protein
MNPIDFTNPDEVKKCIVVVMDMWNWHWCVPAYNRVVELAPHIQKTVEYLRKKGAKIMFSPSDCEKYYNEDHGDENCDRQDPHCDPFAHKALLNTLEHAKPEVKGQAAAFNMPIDSEEPNGSCDGPSQGGGQTRQTPVLTIEKCDLVNAQGTNPDSVFSALVNWSELYPTILWCGVHLNFCVIRRRNGILFLKDYNDKQPVNKKRRLVLIKDLTDTMYTSDRSPNVDHFAGTDLMAQALHDQAGVEFVTSADVLGDGQTFYFGADKRDRSWKPPSRVKLLCHGTLGDNRYVDRDLKMTSSSDAAALWQIESIGPQLVRFKDSSPIPRYITAIPGTVVMNTNIFLSQDPAKHTGTTWYLTRGQLTGPNDWRLHCCGNDLANVIHSALSRLLDADPASKGSTPCLIPNSEADSKSGTQWTLEPA